MSLADLTPNKAGGPCSGREGPGGILAQDDETPRQGACAIPLAPFGTDTRKQPQEPEGAQPLALRSLPGPPCILSGNVSKHVLTGSRQPNLDDLKRRMMSWSVAATTKYSCFSRSSFPSKNCTQQSKLEGAGWGAHAP